MRLRIPKTKKRKLASPRKASIVSRMKKGYIKMQEKKKADAGGGSITLKAIPTSIGVEMPIMPYPVPVGGGPGKDGKEKTERKPVDGFEIKVGVKPRGSAVTVEERGSLVGTNAYYPLIPKNPKKGEPVFAYTNLKWNPATQSVVYSLIEPSITPEDKKLVEAVKTALEEQLDIDISSLGAVQASDTLKKGIDKALVKLAPGITGERKSSIYYYVERDTLGYGKIHALMVDPDIEDISCDGVNIPIYVYHRNPKFASVKSNVVFDSPDNLNSFVIRMAQQCNKTISIASPLLDGTMPDGSRIQATLGTDIAKKGSNFTIRKFTEKPLTPVHMMRYHTMDALQLAYLWMAVESGMTVLISGGTATGKTALLNALSLFIRPNLKVVSIEDTAELRLPLPHWIPHVARTPLAVKGKIGEVTLFDLLKSSLRQRPDYLVLGEVRGKEAFVLFQQIATGHAALATIHAASIPQLIDRLITPPISLPPTLLENVDIVVFMALSRLKGSYVRRTDSIIEIIGVEDGRPLTNKVFEWKPVSDTFNPQGKSVVLKKIAHKGGLTEDAVKDELLRRKIVLEWMTERGIIDYREVARVIAAYYSNPERVMDTIGI